MIRRRDILIIGIALALALCALLFRYASTRGKTADGTVEIYVAGTLYGTARLGQTEDVVIERDGMKNVVSFTENGVYMRSSTCHNQLCVGQGEVTRENYVSRAMGTRIICLPNAVEIRLVLDAPDADAPDI